MSSVTPGESQECYRRLKEIGVGFVDAPVSGGEPGAIAGTLAIMCGGDQADFDRLKPVFEIMGSSALLIGSSGAGSVTKLANQIMVNLNIAAVSEALVLATKAGVDPMKVYHAVRGGLAGSTVLDAKAPMMCKRNFKPGGTIRVNHKDIKNVLATAHEIDVPLPLTAQLFEIQQALKVSGHMDDDHSGYVQYFEQLAGVTVHSEARNKRGGSSDGDHHFRGDPQGVPRRGHGGGGRAAAPGDRGGRHQVHRAGRRPHRGPDGP